MHLAFVRLHFTSISFILSQLGGVFLLSGVLCLLKMQFPLFKSRSVSRGRSSVLDTASKTYQSDVEPRKSYSRPAQRYSILIEDGVEITLPEAPERPRRFSTLKSRPTPQSLDSSSAEFVYTSPRRNRDERAERWVGYASKHATDDGSPRPRRRSVSQQHLEIDYSPRSRRTSRSPQRLGIQENLSYSSRDLDPNASFVRLRPVTETFTRSPSITRSVSTARTPSSTRSRSTARSSSTARSTVTSCSPECPDCAAASASRSPNLMWEKHTRRNSVAAPPR